MPILTTTLRTLTGGTVAWGAWKNPDNSISVSKFTQAQYDDFAVNRKGVGALGGIATDSASGFMMAGGGYPALNTADGYPSQGDVWLSADGVTLNIYVGNSWDFTYSFFRDIDIGNNTANRVGFSVNGSGNWIKCKPGEWSGSADSPTMTKTVAGIFLSNGTLTILQASSLGVTPINQIVSYHHSVAFDAAASAIQNSGTSVTYSHTMSAVANGYIGVFVGGYFGTYFVSGTYAGSSLNENASMKNSSRNSQGGLSYADLTAPTSGPNNVVINVTNAASNEFGATSVSATGVNQGTPTSNPTLNNGTSSPATLTVTSQTGSIVFAEVLSDGVITPDATWTADSAFNTNNTVQAVRHIAGAASVSRSDTLTSPSFWIANGLSVDAAPGPTINTQPSNATAYEGNTATFSVTATTSGGALSYQWYRNGGSIGGATSSSYTTPALTYTTNNADTYYCAVTDNNGTVNTITAVLTVIIVATPCWIKA